MGKMTITINVDEFWLDEESDFEESLKKIYR